MIFDVSDPANPSFVSRFYLEGEGKGIFVKDNYAYLADDFNGLVIFDVSNPTNPDSVSSYNTSGGVEDVFIQDSIAYVAAGSRGLHIINVKDPANPSFISEYGTHVYCVFVQDTLAYEIHP